MLALWDVHLSYVLQIQCNYNKQYREYFSNGTYAQHICKLSFLFIYLFWFSKLVILILFSILTHYKFIKVISEKFTI